MTVEPTRAGKAGCGKPLGHSGSIPIRCGNVGSLCRACRQPPNIDAYLRAELLAAIEKHVGSEDVDTEALADELLAFAKRIGTEMREARNG